MKKLSVDRRPTAVRVVAHEFAPITSHPTARSVCRLLTLTSAGDSILNLARRVTPSLPAALWFSRQRRLEYTPECRILSDGFPTPTGWNVYNTRLPSWRHAARLPARVVAGSTRSPPPDCPHRRRVRPHVAPSKLSPLPLWRLCRRRQSNRIESLSPADRSLS